MHKWGSRTNGPQGIWGSIGDLGLSMFWYLGQGENATATPNSGESKPCGNCALCGNFGTHRNNMVKNTKTVTNLQFSIVKFSRLNRISIAKTIGIYAVRCLLCGQFYVGQTINRFSKRWAGVVSCGELAATRRVN